MNRIGIAAALLAATMISSAPASAQLSVGIDIRLAPPPLPIYAQPPLPGPDYLWTPGYWAWDDYAGAYFWVPGTWVRAPRPGLLWTPPWWGWNDGLYAFHSGYWGPHIGFYGGVSYGFGYTGSGYQGGYWNGGHVFYNRTVNNITNANVTNVYRSNVTVNRVTQVSYNGGPAGIRAQPRPEEIQAMREQHIAPTGNQQAHVAAAHADPQAFATANHGRPPLAATPRPLAGSGGTRPGPRRSFADAPDGATGQPAPMPHAAGRQPPQIDAAYDPSHDAGRAQPSDRSNGGDRGRPDAMRGPDANVHPNGGHGDHRPPPAPHPHAAPHQPPHPHPQGRPPAPHPHPHDDHHR